MPVASLDDLKSRLPDYARDLRINISNIGQITTLTPVQLWGTVLSCAIASRQADVLEAAQGEAARRLDQTQRDAAKAAAAIMSMNNIYYRFTHLVGEPAYARMPANLRMQVIGKPGADKIDFELWCLAVSAINGCGMCLESHEKVLREHGVTRESIQDAVRIAAILHAVAVTLQAEQAAAA